MSQPVAATAAVTNPHSVPFGMEMPCVKQPTFGYVPDRLASWIHIAREESDVFF